MLSKHMGPPLFLDCHHHGRSWSVCRSKYSWTRLDCTLS